MKLLQTILGTTIIAFGSLAATATTNIALAGGHEKNLWECKQGHKLYKSDANQYQCAARAPAGWRISNVQKIRNGQNIRGMYRIGASHNQGNNRRNVNRNTVCDRGYRLYQNDANQYRCEKRQLSGWRPVNQQQQHRNQNQNNYKKVEWKVHNGKRYAVCPRNYKAFVKGSNYGCFPRPQAGWRGYTGLKWEGGKGGNGGGMKMNHNSKYKYDNYRYYRNGRVGCSQGTPVYDRNYTLHCK